MLSKLFAKCEPPSGERAHSFNYIFKGVHSLPKVKKCCPGAMTHWENSSFPIVLFTLAVQTSLEGEGSMVDIRGHARCGSISLVSFSLTQESYPARTCFFLEARLMSLSALFIPSMQSGSLAKGSLAIPRAIPNQPVSSFRNMTPRLLMVRKAQRCSEQWPAELMCRVRLALWAVRTRVRGSGLYSRFCVRVLDGTG